MNRKILEIEALRYNYRGKFKCVQYRGDKLLTHSGNKELFSYDVLDFDGVVS